MLYILKKFTYSTTWVKFLVLGIEVPMHLGEVVAEFVFSILLDDFETKPEKLMLI